MAKKLERKVAVVTRGSSGIGLATAQGFVAEGAHVFITGRRQANSMMLNTLSNCSSLIDPSGPNAATQVPLGRLGTPDEVAKTVVFLGSHDSSYITGIELFVDGAVQV